MRFVVSGDIKTNRVVFVVSQDRHGTAFVHHRPYNPEAFAYLRPPVDEIPKKYRTTFRMSVYTTGDAISHPYEQRFERHGVPVNISD